MANTSVSGLVSGLDTATIISQLMQIEAQPQTNLKNQVSAEQKVVTALQAINAKLAGINTKAGDLAKLTSWSPTTATSTNDKVTVAVDPGTKPTSLTFTVDGLASAAHVSYATTGTLKDTVMTGGLSYQISYQDGRAAETFTTGDGTLQSIVDQINGTTGVKANLLKVGAASDGTPIYRVDVQSTVLGSKSDFTLTQIDPSTGAPVTNPVDFLGGSSGSPVPGTDAVLTLSGGTQLTYSSNTITDLMPGVDVTLAPGATGPATITVGRDVKGMSDSVKAMVDAVNSVLDDIDKQTAYNADTKTSGPLAGESLLRDVRDQLVAAVTKGVGGKSLADVGIQTDRYGKLVFDEAKFQSAYAADPTGVAARFVDSTTTTSTDSSGNTITTTTAPGLAATFAAITKTVSDAYTGTLTLSINGHSSEIKSMQDDISDWDVRLAGKQASLQRQYAALEVALGKLQDQASWLNGQISSLPTMG